MTNKFMLAAKLLPVIFLITSCVEPKDVAIDHPNVRRSEEFQARQFKNIFPEDGEHYNLHLSLMMSDKLVEASKYLELALNMESEKFYYERDLENNKFNCREIYRLIEREQEKHYLIKNSCRDKIGLIQTETRGQEVFKLFYTNNELTSVEVESLPGFEVRVTRFFTEDDKRAMSGVAATMQDSRRLTAQRITGTNRFAITSYQFSKYDQKMRIHPRNHVDGYSEVGELTLDASLEVLTESSGGNFPRFRSVEIQGANGAQSTKLATVNIKAERKELKQGNNFSRFFILGGTLLSQARSRSAASMDHKNCGEMAGNFIVNGNWVTGKNHGEKRIIGNLVMASEAIRYVPGKRMDSSTFEINPELNTNQQNWDRCYNKSRVLPMMPRNKFFLQ
jgi:hypothetical protein